MFKLTCNGICLFSSSSILECFEYIKQAPELMPKSYKSISLELPDWFNRPVLDKSVLSDNSSKVLHIHIHLDNAQF